MRSLVCLPRELNEPNGTAVVRPNVSQHDALHFGWRRFLDCHLGRTNPTEPVSAAAITLLNSTAM